MLPKRFSKTLWLIALQDLGSRQGLFFGTKRSMVFNEKSTMTIARGQTTTQTTDVKVVVASLNPTNLYAAASLVSVFKPFSHYSFQLMWAKLNEQLQQKCNVMVLDGNRLVAYGGWLRVNADDAEKWKREGGELPNPNWVSGQASIVTVVVATDKRYLQPLVRAISHCCAGMKVYRMRSFQDGREDMRRAPITGRRHNL